MLCYKNDQIKISIQNGTCEIQSVDFHKTLGLIIDSNLNWATHIDNLISRLGKGIYALKRLKPITSNHTLRSVYFAYIESLISYGIVYWGGSSQYYMQMVLKAQKRAIRTMANLTPRESCREYFIKLKIMTVVNLYIYQTILSIYKNKYLFTINSDFHDHFTRNGDLLRPKKPLNNTYKNSFLYAGVQHYNRLPQNIREINNDKKFKTCIKVFFTEKCYYSVDEYISDYK